jgi:hypothetical protein
MGTRRKLDGLQLTGVAFLVASAMIGLIFRDATGRFVLYGFFSVGVAFIFYEQTKEWAIKANFPEYSFSIGGGAALIILTMYFDPIGSIFHENNLVKSLTIFVHGRKGKNDVILAGHGFVNMRINGADNPEPIDSKGEAKFSNLRTGDQFQLRISDSEPFLVENPDSQYVVGNEHQMYLQIYLQGIDRVFGSVTYREVPLPGVTIFIDKLKGTTDSAGAFSIQIPLEMQAQSYRVAFQKEGFKKCTKTAYPESMTPLPVSMEKR